MTINLHQFYKMGIICFLVIAISNGYLLFVKWKLMLLAGKVSSISGVVFNIGLVLFFNYLYQQLSPPSAKENMPNQEELDELLESLK